MKYNNELSVANKDFYLSNSAVQGLNNLQIDSENPYFFEMVTAFALADVENNTALTKCGTLSALRDNEDVWKTDKVKSFSAFIKETGFSKSTAFECANIGTRFVKDISVEGEAPLYIWSIIDDIVCEPFSYGTYKRLVEVKATDEDIKKMLDGKHISAKFTNALNFEGIAFYMKRNGEPEEAKPEEAQTEEAQTEAEAEAEAEAQTEAEAEAINNEVLEVLEILGNATKGASKAEMLEAINKAIEILNTIK